MLDASCNLSCIAQTAKFLLDNDIIQSIRQVTYSALVAEIYIIAYEFDIQKRH